MSGPDMALESKAIDQLTEAFRSMQPALLAVTAAMNKMAWWWGLANRRQWAVPRFVQRRRQRFPRIEGHPWGSRWADEWSGLGAARLRGKA
jgi:hypothetical protein